MEIDDNDNIYLCFKDIPGLYKVDAGADREDTPCQLIAGSEALIERGEYIFRHTNGDLYISCKHTGRVIKYSGDQTNHNYCRITVKPKTWFGFKGLNSPSSLILNIADMPHDSHEVERKEINFFNFDWS